MFWRLWWRGVSVKRSQAALALGSLVVGAAITSMLLNLYGDVRRKMTEDFRAYGANVVIAPASMKMGSSAEGSATMEQSALEPLAPFARQISGASFAAVLYGVVRVSPEHTNPRLPEFTNVVVAGTQLGALLRLNSGWREEGKAISADLSPGDCAVGSHLAAKLHLRQGDSIRLHRLSSVASVYDRQTVVAEPPDRRTVAAAFSDRRTSGGHRPPLESAEAGAGKASPLTAHRISTILTTGASEDDQIFLPLGELQSFLGMGDQVTLVELSIPGETRDVESAVHRLAGMLPGLEVRPIRQIVYSEGKVLGTIRWLLLSFTVLILVIIALCVMATMTAIVLERRKDIGMMKALGAADALLMRLFMAEGAGLGLLGGALGYAGRRRCWHAALAARLFGVALSLNLWTLPVVCGLTVALAVIAAQVPVRIVRAIQPTVVLKGE